MPQSLAKVVIHLVYSTKGRRPWLADPDLRHELYAYQAAILRDKVDSPALIINGVDDHVPALLLLSRKFAMANVVEEAKTSGSRNSAPIWPTSIGSLVTAFSRLASPKLTASDVTSPSRRSNTQGLRFRTSSACYAADTTSPSTNGSFGTDAMNLTLRAAPLGRPVAVREKPRPLAWAGGGSPHCGYEMARHQPNAPTGANRS